jgi:hypothetical protein
MFRPPGRLRRFDVANIIGAGLLALPVFVMGGLLALSLVVA